MSKNADQVFPSDNEASGTDDHEIVVTKKKSKAAPIKKLKPTASSSTYRPKNADPVFLSDEGSDIEDGEIIEVVPKKRSKPSPPAAKKPKPTRTTYRPKNGDSDDEDSNMDDNGIEQKKVKPSAPAPKKSKQGRTCKPTMRDLFGGDTDDDEASNSGGKDPPKLPCYITRRVANGYAKQFFPEKRGGLYVELKVYECSEIEQISPMNRWRQAIIALKTRADNNSKSWDYLAKYVKEVREEFKPCPTNFTNYS